MILAEEIGPSVTVTVIRLAVSMITVFVAGYASIGLLEKAFHHLCLFL
jgi:hypothetical protein